MRHIWRQIRRNWNRTDTWVSVSNTLALAALSGNCWWESITVTYVAVGTPLAAELWRACHDRTLRDAYFFGGMVAGLWPIGEWGVVHVLGWWGNYVVGGVQFLETPLYCMLVGCAATTFCVYTGKRAIEFGYGNRTASLMCGGSALILGIVGENLFVAAQMWVYEPSTLELGRIPAFLPIGYGLGYAVIPFLNRLVLPLAVLTFCLILLVTTVGFGLLVGFFPR